MAKSKLEILINAKDEATGPISGIGRAISGMTQVAGGILAAGFIQQIGSSLAGLTRDSISAASDLAETANKINVVFGDAAEQINQFAANAATTLGQSTQQALDAAATFGVFGKSAGLAGTDLADFSTSLVSLSSDFASFYNASPEQAIEAIGAALRGESEPIRAFGVLLDDATLRAKAMEIGLTNTTKNALTPQQRVLAAYNVILDQTKDAQGDFIRTSDGLANSQRIMEAQFANLKAEIGTQFLPIMTQAAQVISKILMPAASTFLNNFIYPAIPAITEFASTAIDLFSRLASGAINFRQAIFELAGEEGLGLFGQAQTFFQPLIDAIGRLFASVQTTFPIIQEIFSQMWQQISWIFAQFGPQIILNVSTLIDSIGALWQQHGAQVINILSSAFVIITLAITSALTIITGIVGAALALLTGDWETAISVLQETFTTFLSTILVASGTTLEEFTAVWSSNFAMLVTIVQTGIALAIQAVRDAIASMRAAGEALIDGLKAGIDSRAQSMLASVRGVAGQITSMFTGLFGIRSPSKVMEGIGKNLMLGMEQGIQGAAFRPQMAAATAATGVNSVVFNQQNSISSPIDVQVLAYRTAEIIQRNGRR